MVLHVDVTVPLVLSTFSSCFTVPADRAVVVVFRVMTFDSVTAALCGRMKELVCIEADVGDGSLLLRLLLLLLTLLPLVEPSGTAPDL